MYLYLYTSNVNISTYKIKCVKYFYKRRKTGKWRITMKDGWIGLKFRA